MKPELLFIISIAAVFICGCTKVPESIGVKEGKLGACPDKPNCVSTTAKDKAHFIEPFRYAVDSVKVKSVLLEVINSQERTRIITDSGNYIHAEFKSKVFRFTDDVEFLIDDKDKIINIRSASRIGYSDMGVNRTRIENLRLIFQDKIKQ